MKKLSNTWRHQKIISVNPALPSKSIEHLTQNSGRRRLGRLPITSASVTDKPNLAEKCETFAIASFTTDNDINENIPSSFLSTLSASVDNDLIKELEKVEAALINGIQKSQIHTDSISASRNYTPKKERNTIELKPTSNTSSKRKYIKSSDAKLPKAHTSSISGKQFIPYSLRTSVNPVDSPTSSPIDKRSKHSAATDKSQDLDKSVSKNKSHAFTTPKSSFQRRNLNKDISTETANALDPNDSSSSSCKLNLNGNDSFNFSDISFSPICSTPGGNIDVVDISEDESPKARQSVCRGLLRNDKGTTSKETNVGSQKKKLTESYITLKPDTGTNCDLKTRAEKFSPSVISQKRSRQKQILSPVVITLKRGRRSQTKIQLNEANVATHIQADAKISDAGCKDNNQQSPPASESFSGGNNQIGGRTQLQPQQQNLKSGCHDNPNVSGSKGHTGQVFRDTTPDISRSRQIGQCNLSSTSGNANLLQENSFNNTSLTADKRQLTSWGLPEPVLEAYKRQGVETMFEWQAECLLTDHVLGGGNLVYSAPTSAGKTLVAELLILKRVLETRKKALFILPFVSVVREKMFSLQQLFQNAGIRVGGYMGSHSPPGGFQNVHIAVCTIEKGNGLINRLMEEGKLGELGAVVIDELHMVGDSHRGYLLELMLTKLAYIVQRRSADNVQGFVEFCLDLARTKDGSSDCQVQIIGMSATLPNLPLLAKWLNASLYCTDFRPVPLTEYIKIDSKLLNGELIIEREIPALLISPDDADHVVALCIETVSNGHGVLVFCPTKNWCEKLCETVARRFYTLQDRTQESLKDGVSNKIPLGAFRITLDRSSLMETVEQLRRSPVGLDPMLGKCVHNGVAYHHAGLTFDERDIIEGAFRQGHLKVVVATSTLSSGVNLPARRVIIRTPMFFGKVIDTLTYKQMVGRAGRKGIDTEGESILVCKSQEKNVGKKLMEAQLPPVESCLHFDADEGLSRSLKRAVLEVVVSGVATTPADVCAYVNCTLLSASLCEDSQNNLKAAVAESCIKFLQENEFVAVNVTQNEDGTESRKFYPTQLGSAILASSLSPDEGLLVFAELQKARKAFVLDTELHIIYLVTPVYASDVSTSIDWYHYHHQWETLTPADRRVADIVGVSESFIARAIQGRINGKTEAQRKALAIHQRFYTALVLNCLIQECPLMEVAARFNCNKGQLQSLQQSASTFAGMITVFCGRLGWHSLELILSQFHKRLSFGVQQELVELVRISTLNASSARMLYNAGYHTVTDVARAETADIENLFKNTVPFQSEKRQEGETDWELKERRRARCIWLTGRKGVTELDAALAIIEEAKVIVEGDLGVTGITWAAKDKHEESSVEDDSEDSTVNEGHLEFSEDRGKDGRSITECSSKLHQFKGNVTATSGKVECDVSASGIGAAMMKQENRVPRVVQTSSTDKTPNAAEEPSQRKLSHSKRRSSNERFQNSGSSPFFSARIRERSFFGQTVVSPPVGVRKMLNDTSGCAKGQTAAYDGSRIGEFNQTAHCEIMTDRAAVQETNNVTVVKALSKQGETPIATRNCTAPSLPGETPVVTRNCTAPSLTGETLVATRNCTAPSLTGETPVVTRNCTAPSLTAETGVTIIPSNSVKDCASSNSNVCTVVNRTTPILKSEQCEVVNSSSLSISFSESFEIDTQTANIINHDGQGIEQNHPTTTRGLRHGSLSTSEHTTPDMNICPASRPPVSACNPKLQDHLSNEMNKIDVDQDSRRASPDPFMDSMSESLLFDFEDVEEHTLQKKSPSDNSCGIIPDRFSEPLFDSTEMSQEKPVRSDESTPKRTVPKSVNFLKFCPDNLAEENKIGTSNTDRHKWRRLSESVALSQSFDDSIITHEHRTIKKNVDEEDLCSSLIAASNYEHLADLDDGILEEEASQSDQLNYSCADLHIIETCDIVNRNKTLYGCRDKNLPDTSRKSSCQHKLNDKESVHKVSKADLVKKSKDCIASIYGKILQTTQDMDHSSSLSSSKCSKKQSVPRLKNTVSIPQSSTPFGNVKVRGQGNISQLSQAKKASKVQTTVKSVLDEYVTNHSTITCKQVKECSLKVTDASEFDDLFSGSFSSSLMDRVMKECNGISEAGSPKITNGINDTDCCTTLGKENKTQRELGTEGVHRGLQDGQLSPRKEATEPGSNNSSRNDGSDCVPPTPPNETSNAASPFRISFYSPMKQKASTASNSVLTPKGDNSKHLRSRQSKDGFTAIKDRITREASSTNQFNKNKQVSHSSVTCSANVHLAEPSNGSPVRYSPAQRGSQRNIVPVNLVSAPSISTNMPVKSSSKVISVKTSSKGMPVESSSKVISVESSNKGMPVESSSKGSTVESSSKGSTVESSSKGMPVESSSKGSTVESSSKGSTVESSGKGMHVESAIIEQNPGLSVSQALSQELFTIIDVCANKRLFETFVAEVKSKPYIALSVACEKKPPQGKQAMTSEIGGRFLRSRTSPSIPKPKMAVGVPVPDSDAFIVGLAISWENRDSYFVSLMPAGDVPRPAETSSIDSLSEPPLDNTLTQEERIQAVADILHFKPGRHERTVAVYNSKATFVCLAKALGLSLSHCEDPCVASWLRDPCAKLKNLHHMVVCHCPEELGLLDAIGGVKGYHSMGSDITSRVDGRLRACTESVLTQRLMSKFHALLADEHLLAAFTDVEMPAVVTLARMELNGFGISESEIEQQQALLTAKLNMLEEQAYRMAGHVFSLTSLTDVATILYQELKLPVNGDPTLVPHLPTTHGRQGKRGPVGGTSKEILEKLQKFHPLPAVILEWRRLSSALTKSIFALKRAAQPCPQLGMVRVYGDCQIFTSTGRVSMAEPNLQNIPKDFAINLPYFDGKADKTVNSSNVRFPNRRVSALGSLNNSTKGLHCNYVATAPVSMRKMFVPFRGGIMLAADYSQLELRIIAHLSSDPKLASILNTPDGDVFKIIAAQMKGLDIPEVSSELRQQAKQVCYGILYGIGTKALAEQLGTDERDADVFMETFKSRYPGVRKYLQSTVEFCQKTGYVTTMFNRRRYLPSIKDSNGNTRAQAERQAVNTTIQGSAADLVKVAMSNIDRKLMDLFPDTRRSHCQAPLTKGLSSGRNNNNIPPVNGAYLVLQLHDELIYEVSADHVLEVARMVKHHMETAVRLSICMPVKIRVGPSWGELADYDCQA